MNTLLDDLLTGNVQVQTAIIKRILENDEEHFNRLTVEKAKRLKYKNGAVVDDFNTIMNEIFVKRSFNGDNPVLAEPLDKDDFVKKLGIRICPYT